MNHLAHFFLSGHEEDIIIGNFIADFIVNKERALYTEGVQHGIFIHREIDAFTDNHEVVKQSTKRLHPHHHKYSPVIVDIYYDYLLFKNWDLFVENTPYQGVSTRTFINTIYDLLISKKNELPKKLQSRIDYMIADDWLTSYTHFEGLHTAFKRIEKHASFPGNFEKAAHHLQLYLQDFDNEFKLFFPDLMDHVNAIPRITQASTR